LKIRATLLVLTLIGAPFAASVLNAGDHDIEAVRARLRNSRKGSAAMAEVDPRGTTGTVATSYGTKRSTEAFRVTAQYRGVVKKRSNDLGGGNLRCWQEAGDGPDEFRVRLNANAVTPDGKDSISFDVFRRFRLNGSQVQVLEEKNTFGDYARKYETKIVNTVSLAYLIKFRCPADANRNSPAQSYVINGRTYTLGFNYANKHNRQSTEVTLTDNEGVKPIGKFFLRPPVNGVRPFQYFRIYTRDNVVVEFTII
jgi:hypothetical protein